MVTTEAERSSVKANGLFRPAILGRHSRGINYVWSVSWFFPCFSGMGTRHTRGAFKPETFLRRTCAEAIASSPEVPVSKVHYTRPL